MSTNSIYIYRKFSFEYLIHMLSQKPHLRLNLYLSMIMNSYGSTLAGSQTYTEAKHLKDGLWYGQLIDEKHMLWFIV